MIRAEMNCGDSNNGDARLGLETRSGDGVGNGRSSMGKQVLCVGCL